jgi:flagellar hook-basal body complex protein FliE
MEISRISPPSSAGIPDLKPGKLSPAGKQFSGVLQDALQDVERVQVDADQRVRGMLDGDGEDLHSTMLAVEKASLSFELMMQMRNKVVNAYQEIARLQF